MLMRAFRTWARDRSGIAATEFALLAPVLLVIISGAAELSGAITSSNRATYVADAIGEMVSRTPLGTTLSDDDLQNFALAGVVTNPDIVRYARQAGTSLQGAFKVTISSVAITKKSPLCILSCESEANVVFSWSLSGPKRVCGQKLTPASGPTDDLTALPQELFRPGSLVVVDVAVFHRPLVFGFIKYFGGDITFKRSSYFRPRYRDRVDATANCSGYPST